MRRHETDSTPVGIGSRLLDRYELTAVLGRGGMGVVYAGRDPRLDREVAVKVIGPESWNEEIEERFQREARAVARMDHPAIVPIFDFGRHEGHLFFVMPLVRGETLYALIRSRTLAVDQILRIAARVAEGLDYGHARGIIHRDVKPGNLMVSNDGGELRVRIMDYGLARTLADAPLSGSITAIGTPVYLSPEQILGESLDGRSDLYSLGTVLYECLAGEPPFQGTMFSVVRRILHEEPLPLRDRGVDVSDELEELIAACLAKTPAQRPSRGLELAKSLDQRRRELAEPSSGPATASTAPIAVAPLAGREDETIELRRRLDMALAGECQLLLVGGDPGIGKSRLVQELVGLARASGILVLTSRFVDRETSLPYQGFCGLIQDYFRSRAGAGESRDALPDFSGVASELIALFPVLSEIRELRAARRNPTSGDGEGPATAPAVRPTISQPGMLFEVLARALTLLAGGRALVVVIEHLHHADASIGALRYAFHRLGPSPILIVGTYRTTEVDRRHPLTRLARSLADDPRFGSLVLESLSASAFRELIGHEVGSSGLDEAFVDELLETAEGNPYFGLELTRSYIESGSLERNEEGVWRLSEAASQARPPLPPTIHQTVEGRIERLERGLRHVLSLASVLGRSFEYQDLERLIAKATGPAGKTDLDLDEALDVLVARGLLEEGSRARGDWISFSSGVVREVLYVGLSRRRRKSLHRSHALDLEKRNAGRLERVYPRLLQQFAAAEMAEKTVEYAASLARKALEAWSPADAVGALKTALELVEDVAEPVAAEGELRGLLAQAYRATGDLDRALAEAARAADAFERTKAPDKVVGMVVLAAETAWQMRRVEGVKAWVEKGLELARRCGTVEALERLLTLGATVANLRGEYESAREYLVEAEDLAGSTGPIRLAVRDAAAAERLTPMRRGGTLVIALKSPLVNLDPGAIKIFEEQEIAANVFETLVASDDDGNLIPWLCQGWHGSPDATSFVFEMRSDVRFTDGRRLTAREVKASLERSARRKAYSPPVALAALAGLDEHLAGEADDIRGIEVLAEGADERLRFHLREPLPIFPTTLMDLKTAVSRPVTIDGIETLVGTGPFRIVAHHDRGPDVPGRVVLERHSGYWRGPAPNLERIEILTLRDNAEIVAGLGAGQIDLAKDMRPDELEELLRDPQLRAGWVEVATKNVYFLLFNDSGPSFREPDEAGLLRRALVESIRVHDLVWRSLGRFGMPASSLIPPGVFGHDTGRRRPGLRLEESRGLVRVAAGDKPVELRAVIHPIFRDRFAAFLESLLELWSRLGVEISDETPTMKSYLSRWAANDDIDVFLGRWNGEYEDPDGYTFALFHSRHGLLRRYYSSPEADRILELARRERRPASRKALYRRFEALLDEAHAAVPLFYDTDHRVAGSQVLGLRLSNTRPWVNYAEMAKGDPPPRARARGPREVARTGAEIHVPLAARIEAADPSDGDFADLLEVTSNIYETLTRIDKGARAAPWLALSCESRSGGRSFRFVLPHDVRFHDGRRLTSRDVRYTYERALRRPGCDNCHLLLPIRGARAFAAGDASEIAGLELASATEIVIELERPLALFPALLAHGSLAVLPEGGEPGATSWRDGCAGTGPFRVVGLFPGERLELERNPYYRRPDLPRSERLVFHFGVGSESALAGLREGRFSLASQLRPRDLEELRRDAEMARGSHEVPSLSTFFLVFNTRRGPFADRRRRRDVRRILDPVSLVEASLGRRATPARGVFPPGLLGSHTFGDAGPPRRSSDPGSAAPAAEPIPVRAAVHPALMDQYAELWKELEDRLRRQGFALEAAWGERPEVSARSLGTPPADFDLAIDRGYAYYPDADHFAVGMLHSELGRLGAFFASEEIDRASEQARWETDPATRHGLYRAVERTLESEALLVPLFHEHTYTICHPRVRGFRSGFSFPAIRFERLTSVP